MKLISGVLIAYAMTEFRINNGFYHWFAQNFPEHLNDVDTPGKALRKNDEMTKLKSPKRKKGRDGGGGDEGKVQLIYFQRWSTEMRLLLQRMLKSNEIFFFFFHTKNEKKKFSLLLWSFWNQKSKVKIKKLSLFFFLCITRFCNFEDALFPGESDPFLLADKFTQIKRFSRISGHTFAIL